MAEKTATAEKPTAEYIHRQVLPIGGQTPILHGLRVVELAEVVAAPSCSFVLAQLGAEVVKVESPAGDMMRNFFKQFEGVREYASAFEAANGNKASIVLDLKKASDMTVLREILAEADVFITNVRPNSLRSLGLDYEVVGKCYPRLIYAHLTGWGRDGPEASLPGYDLGSFWSMSGLSAILHPEGLHQHMTVGFGDSATGLSMLGAILVALHERFTTGRGQLIDASLLRCGFWCMSKYLCNTNNREVEDVQFTRQIPDYKGQMKKYSEQFSEILYNIYESKDGVSFCVLGLTSSPRENSKNLIALAAWLQLGGVAIGEQDVRTQLAQLDFEAIKQGLGSIQIPCCRSYRALELFDPYTVSVYQQQGGRHSFNSCEFLSLVSKSAGCFSQIPAVVESDPKVRRLVNPPFRCHSSQDHGMRTKAPSMGAHTQSFLAKRWSPRVPDLEAKGHGKTMKDVVVVELSEWGSTVAGACMQLQDYGAKVIKIIGPEGDHWQRRDPEFFLQMNRGKELVSLDLKTSEGINALLELLSQATVFATNWAVPALEDAEIDFTTIRAKFPALIYLLTVPFALSLFGEGSLELEREMHSKQGSLGAQWLCSGLGDFLGGTGRRPPLPPDQLLDLMASYSALAGISAALVHLRRTGEGQLVDVSLFRAGLYTLAFNYTMTQHDPIKTDFFGSMGHLEKRTRWPNPTTLSFCTKDGMWLQMLGVEMPRHLTPTMKVLGVRFMILVKAIPRVVQMYLKPKHPSGTKLFSLYPLLEIVNTEFTRVVESLTWEQVKTLFDNNNVWYVPIMTPDLAVRNRQAHATRLFCFDDTHLRLVAPTQIGPPQPAQQPPQSAL